MSNLYFPCHINAVNLPNFFLPDYKNAVDVAFWIFIGAEKEGVCVGNQFTDANSGIEFGIRKCL